VDLRRLINTPGKAALALLVTLTALHSLSFLSAQGGGNRPQVGQCQQWNGWRWDVSNLPIQAPGFQGTGVGPGTIDLGSGVTFTAGMGAPITSCSNGSLYLRIDGAAGTTLYLCEAKAWAPK
jgi:hypothetical protein